MANGKTLIRGACVLTMDEDLGTIHDGDVRIEGEMMTRPDVGHVRAVSVYQQHGFLGPDHLLVPVST